MTAEQLSAFRELVSELVRDVMPDRFPVRVNPPEAMYGGWRSPYCLAVDRCEAAFGITDPYRDPDRLDAYRRMHAAARRVRALIVRKAGRGATELRARVIARTHIEAEVKRGETDERITEGGNSHFGGGNSVSVGGSWCHVHNRRCRKSRSVFVFEVNGDPCCYRFTLTELRRDILAPAQPKQMDLFAALHDGAA